MKLKHIILFMTVLACTLELSAQVTEHTAASSGVSTYEKMMNSMDGAVNVPDYLDRAMVTYIDNNASRRNLCYRIRIYFNNSQNARTESSHIVKEFSERYPSVPVYNQYANPYFKVTVGDFRTKSDAMKFLTQVKSLYTSAFLVREPFTISQTTR